MSGRNITRQRSTEDFSSRMMRNGEKIAHQETMHGCVDHSFSEDSKACSKRGGDKKADRRKRGELWTSQNSELRAAMVGKTELLKWWLGVEKGRQGR